MRICTAKASGISRETVKSRCAREWGGWGRISVDGPGQNNPDRSEGPWGRAAWPARTEVLISTSSLTQSREFRWTQRARRAMANQRTGKAAPEIPALKPYRGKPAVRNFRGGNGNVGIIRSPVRAIALPDSSGKMSSNRPKESSLLSEFSRDLTQAARDGLLDPLIGRDYELERVVQILCRRRKNNPVLIGESGVGKTAIVEGLAQRIADGEVPSFLADKRILALDLSLIVAGTKYRGQFEERLKTIMKELMESQNAISFIDELHTLVGAGSAEGSLDAANILKPALSRGEIQCIGATTPGEYRKSIEK